MWVFVIFSLHFHILIKVYCGRHVDHYVREPHLRRVRTKNRDTQIACLHHHVSRYRVIGDTRPSAFAISIHWRRAKLERVSHYMTHPRYALRVRVTDFIAGWGP
jgi:hypothetical protein